MTRYLECLWMIARIAWTLFTDEEQRRQYEYDLGYGEINTTTSTKGN